MKGAPLSPLDKNLRRSLALPHLQIFTYVLLLFIYFGEGHRRINRTEFCDSAVRITNNTAQNALSSNDSFLINTSMLGGSLSQFGEEKVFAAYIMSIMSHCTVAVKRCCRYLKV